MRAAVLCLSALLSFAALPAAAMGSRSDDPPAKAEDTNWTAAQAAVKAGRYEEAVPLLQQVVGKDPKNADAYNYLGYANGRIGRNDEALAHYRQALAINPTHRGANEYMGELYLKLGNLAAAEDRLKVLDGACTFGCAEYDALKKAVADFKAGGSFRSGKGF